MGTEYIQTYGIWLKKYPRGKLQWWSWKPDKNLYLEIYKYRSFSMWGS